MTAAEWSVAFAADAADDLNPIGDHLIRGYRDFGESPTESLRHAETRIEGIITTAERLTTAPFCGEAHDTLLPGLRQLVLDSAVYWFVADDDARQIRVLAVLFGAQDFRRHMLLRLLQKGAR